MKIFDNILEKLIFTLIICTIISISSLVLIILKFYLNTMILGINTKEIKDKHIIISGGSTGLGKQLAITLIKNDCKKITIVARNIQNLKNTLNELQQFSKDINSNCDIQILELNVIDFEKCKVLLKNYVNNNPKIDWIIANAGTCIPELFDKEFEVKNESSMMQVNYFGALNFIKLLLSYSENKVIKYIKFYK